MTRPNVIDRLFDALSAGDLETARECLTPNVRLWHSFDQVAMDREAAMGGFADFISNFAARSFVDVRRHAIEGGFVQQHLMTATRHSGEVLAWPVCIVVQIDDDRIVRLDEYIDRAGIFTPRPGAVSTPGF
jgi:ketosteroid isomerase-like protein